MKPATNAYRSFIYNFEKWLNKNNIYSEKSDKNEYCFKNSKYKREITIIPTICKDVSSKNYNFLIIVKFTYNDIPHIKIKTFYNISYIKTLLKEYYKDVNSNDLFANFVNKLYNISKRIHNMKKDF